MTDHRAAKGFLVAQLLTVLLVPIIIAARGAAAGPLTLPQSLGAAVKGYRTAFGLTQTVLAQRAGMTSARLSRIERGLDTTTTAEQDRLVLVLDSVFRSQFHPDTERRIMAAVARARLAHPTSVQTPARE